jgi:hypothetical protein
LRSIPEGKAWQSHTSYLEKHGNCRVAYGSSQ